jgi:small GTP-binding protein
MNDAYQLKVKVCLAGDSSVGKTSLVRRYVMDMFDERYVSTLGTKISKKRINIKKADQNYFLTLSIWDVLGQDKLKNIQAMAFEGAKGFFVVCDFTRKETLSNIKTWIARIKESAGEIPGLLLVNKCDQCDCFEMTEEDIRSIAEEFNLPYYMTSAKEGENVINPFFKLGNLIIDRIFYIT